MDKEVIRQYKKETYELYKRLHYDDMIFYVVSNGNKFIDSESAIDESLEELKNTNEERYKNGKSHLSYGQYILRLKDEKQKEG